MRKTLLIVGTAATLLISGLAAAQTVPPRPCPRNGTPEQGQGPRDGTGPGSQNGKRTGPQNGTGQQHRGPQGPGGRR